MATAKSWAWLRRLLRLPETSAREKRQAEMDARRSEALAGLEETTQVLYRRLEATEITVVPKHPQPQGPNGE